MNDACNKCGNDNIDVTYYKQADKSELLSNYCETCGYIWETETYDVIRHRELTASCVYMVIMVLLVCLTIKLIKSEHRRGNSCGSGGLC